MSAISNGTGPISASDEQADLEVLAHAGDATAPAGTAATSTDPAIANAPGGDVGKLPTLADVVSNMGAQAIKHELEAGGASKAEAAANATDATQQAQELQDLEAQLKSWQDYRDCIEHCVDDPDVNDDFGDASWLQMDLADADWNIAMLQQQIAGGEQSLEDLIDGMSQYFDAALSTLDLAAKVNDTKSQQIDDQVARAANDRSQEAQRRRRETDLDTQRQQLRSQLEEQGLIRPLPPTSKAARDEATKMRDALRDKTLERNLDSLVQLKDLLRRLRPDT